MLSRVKYVKAEASVRYTLVIVKKHTRTRSL